MEPPPSPPVARLTNPPATAAADPPDDPPTVRPRCHGLWVTPFSLVMLTLSPPNSLALVSPTGTAPPRSRSRSTTVEVRVATRSRNTSDASVSGHPATDSSSLMPAGTPPKGWDTSAARAASYARSGSRNEKQFRSVASMAARVASSSSTGDRSPARKASTREEASPDHGSDMEEMFALEAPVPFLGVGLRPARTMEGW